MPFPIVISCRARERFCSLSLSFSHSSFLVFVFGRFCVRWPFVAECYATNSKNSINQWSPLNWPPFDVVLAFTNKRNGHPKIVPTIKMKCHEVDKRLLLPNRLMCAWIAEPNDFDDGDEKNAERRHSFRTIYHTKSRLFFSTMLMLMVAVTVARRIFLLLASS